MPESVGCFGATREGARVGSVTSKRNDRSARLSGVSELWTKHGYAAYRGPIAGLYHCGAGALPGGGVTGLPGRTRPGR